jgi:mono/diheme cytochrome c family protein
MRPIVVRICGSLLMLAFAAAVEASGPQRRPRDLTTESLTGRDTFEAYCAPCHGRRGAGDGPVAKAIRTRPPDLRRLSDRYGFFPRDLVVAYVAGADRTVAAHGTDMPGWGFLFRTIDPSDTHVRVRLRNVVEFVESLQIAPKK